MIAVKEKPPNYSLNFGRRKIRTQSAMTCTWKWESENPAVILVDVLIFFTVLTILVGIEWGAFQPFKTLGFYCYDPKLSFPFRGDTVGTNLLLIVSFVLPWFIFMIVEWFAMFASSSLLHKNPKDAANKRVWLKKTRYWYFRYLYGLCFTFLITDLAKVLIGEPRPHFFYTCQPKFDGMNNCTQNDYITNFVCTGKSSQLSLLDSNKSFPSGHASFSSYFGIFMMLYFSRTIKTKSQFLVYFLQILCIFWTLACSLTRITDHRHHWWDVMAGAMLGITVALYFYRAYKHKTRNNIMNNDKNKNFQTHLMVNSNE